MFRQGAPLRAPSEPDQVRTVAHAHRLMPRIRFAAATSTAHDLRPTAPADLLGGVSPGSGPAQTTLHKGRLEALSDGVFAVVLTLLVLDLKLDHLPRHASDAEVWAALREIARPLFGYAFSFIIVAIFWVLQDRKFAFLTHTNIRHAAWTFAFLFGVTLMPFSVSIYLRAMNSGAANLIYFGNFTFIAAMLVGAWFDARRTGLVNAATDPIAIHQFTIKLVGMTLANAAGAAVAYFQPTLAAPALVVIALVARFLKKRAA